MNIDDAAMAKWHERLRLAREQARLTQKALADRIGASQAAIAQWERVEREPSLEKFGQLATATGTDPRCIIFGDEPKSQADGDLVADDRLKRDLILQLIVSVERRLGREYIRLTPEAKARLIIALHDIATTLGGENKVVEHLDRYIDATKR